MAGISSEAAKGIAYPTNKKKYNGIEETRDLGLNQYDAQLRILDPQIGIWLQVDPETENMEMWSPYSSNYNNPILYKDPLGNAPECCGGILDVLSDMGDRITIAVTGTVFGALNSLSGGVISSDPLGYRNALITTEYRQAYDQAVFTGQASTWMPVPAGGRKMAQSNPELVTPGGAKLKVEIPALPEVPTTNNIKQSNSNSTTNNSSVSPTTVSQKPLSSVKKAVAEAQAKVGGSLPKGKDGKYGSPQRGDSRKGYRLDPGHPNKPAGHPEAGPHVNWWDYSGGKNKTAGGKKGAIPIQ